MISHLILSLSMLWTVSAKLACECSSMKPFTTDFDIAFIHFKNIYEPAINDEMDFVEIRSIVNTECSYRIEKSRLVQSENSNIVAFEDRVGDASTCFTSGDRVDVLVSSSKCCPDSPLKTIAENIALNFRTNKELLLDFQLSVLKPTADVKSTQDSSGPEQRRKLLSAQSFSVEITSLSSKLPMKVVPCPNLPTEELQMASFLYKINDISDESRAPQLSRLLVSGTYSLYDICKEERIISNWRPGRTYQLDWQLKDSSTDLEMAASSVKFTTTCSCADSITSDAPRSFSAYQKYGKVFFKFTGSSVCGNGFSFFRQKKDSNTEPPVVFTPDYTFFGNQACSMKFAPKDFCTDDVSKLELGETYQYSIQSVGFAYRGSSAIVDFSVLWESRLSGYVLAGQNFPIPDVTVELGCYESNGLPLFRESGYTLNDGSFSFHVKSKAFKEHSVQCEIRFEKSDWVDNQFFDHKFLCNEGKSDCSSSPLKVMMTHLDFDHSIIAEDVSVSSVTGKVFVANTDLNSNGVQWGDGCPMENVKVCLIDKSVGAKSRELACANTTSDGTYELPGVHGTHVFVIATHKKHEFVYASTNSKFDPDEGIFIESGKTYDGLNFKSISTTDLNITLAGGLCDIFLGDSIFTVKIPGCPWRGLKLKQASVTSRHRVNAQLLEVTLDTVDGRPNIPFYQTTIDLVDALELIQLNSSEAIPKIRFQFNGVTKLRASFTHNRNFDCQKMNYPPLNEPADELVVLPFQTAMLATFYIEQDFEQGLRCDNIDPSSLQLLVHNNLGVLYNNKDDELYKAFVEKFYPPDVAPLLSNCNNGCEMNITRDYEPSQNLYKRSRVEFYFMTGRPNIFEPYTKSLTVSTNEINSVTYRIQAVIVGQFKLGDRKTVGLPTYEPLLIIRDPPGGGSSSYFKNVESFIRLKNHEHKEYVGVDNRETGVLGFSGTFKKCSGFGFLECSTFAEAKDVFGYKRENTFSGLDQLNQQAHAGGISTVWSYTTSSSSNFVGNLSDIYVMPNLELKYIDTATVNWNFTTCQASRVDEITYSLQSPENTPIMSFVSGYEIENVEIPSLRKLIQQVSAEINNCNCRDSDPYRFEELQEKLAQFEDALEGWMQAIETNHQTKLSAKSGDNLVRPNQWFDKIAEPNVPHKWENGSASLSHNSGFVSDSFLKNARIRDRFKDDVSDDLETMNTIKFSGGGSTLQFHLNRKSLEKVFNLLGDENKNREWTKKFGGGASFEATLAVFFSKIEAVRISNNKTTESNRQTTDESMETSIGFTLSDPQIGDVFDVEVYIDPRFGTFVFHTASGRSMCPHEDGTVEIAQPYFEIVGQPSSTILADEKITFQLKVGNQGEQAAPFVLNYENKNISYGGLSFYRALPVTFDLIHPGETVVLTLSVTRGPTLYEYPPLVIKFQVGCEAGMEVELDAVSVPLSRVVRTLSNAVDVNGNPKLVYARPCPKIEFAGLLLHEPHFAITTTKNLDGIIEVAIRNPETEYLKMFEATQTTPSILENIQLEYRRVGSQAWKVGHHTIDNVKKQINFASKGLESEYGIMVVYWEAGTDLIDGDYEMRVVTKCPAMNGAPLGYNSYATPIVSGVVDRKPLYLFGHPMPRNKVEAGQNVIVKFNKPLDCYQPYLFSVKIIIDENLKTFENSNLLIVCEERTISVQFDLQTTPLNELVGHTMFMNLAHVQDINGNMINEDIVYRAEIIPASSENPRPRRRLMSKQLDDLLVENDDLLIEKDEAAVLESRVSEVLGSLDGWVQRTASNMASEEAKLLAEMNTNLRELDVQDHLIFVLMGVIASLLATLALFGFVQIRKTK